MIIYNKTWLNNLKVVNLTEKENKEGFIPDSEILNINRHFRVGFYSPNIFVRAGLFLLTCVISTFSCGFLSLLMSDSGILETFGWVAFLGALNYAALEIITGKKFHFKSGVDDALLCISVVVFTVAFIWATDATDQKNYVTTSIFIFLLSTGLTLRFNYRLMSLVSFLSAAATVFFAWQKTGSVGLLTMPFVLMLFSGLSYWLLKKIEVINRARFYLDSVFVMKIAALLLLYLSGNYYVVKELGDMLHGTVSKSVPYGWIFWMWTMLVPVVYLAFGIRTKKAALMRLGFVLSIGSILTFRTYYHLMPVEYALILGGLIALAISYLVTKYLKTPKRGFTSEEQDYQSLADKLNLESLIISETLSGIGQPTQQESSPFGGGQFGGGGAESNF